MKKASIFLSVVLASVAISAPAFAADACPNFAGKYKMISEVQNGVSQTLQPNATIVITQNACQEVTLGNGTDATVTPLQDMIIDGQPHVAGGVDDVHVTFTLTSHFEGNTLVSIFGMTSLPGQNLGTITLALGSDLKTLTYTMNVQGQLNTFTAVKE
jgi:hypothetical protein